MKKGALSAFISALGLVLIPAPDLCAQTIRGRIVSEPLGLPEAHALVLLLDGASVIRADVEADADGRFELEVPVPGRYSLRVDTDDWGPLTSASFDMAADQVFDIELRLSNGSINLARQGSQDEVDRRPAGLLRDFFARQQRGFPGQFITRQEIEAKNPIAFTDILRSVAGVRVVPMRPAEGTARRQYFTVRLLGSGQNCPPMLWTDGFRRGSIDGPEGRGPDLFLGPQDIEGIEIYRVAEAPGEFAGEGSRCGVIVVWTSRGVHRAAARSDLRSALSGGAGVGFDNSVLEFAFRPGRRDEWGAVIRIRAGKYNPRRVLGREVALREGFKDHPWYLSIYLGRQGPVFLAPRSDLAYMRVAVGMSWYGRRPTEPQQGTALVASTVTRIAGGGELAVGLRPFGGGVRPWIEVGAGAEYIQRAGVRFVRPGVLLGVEIGGRSR